MLNINIRISLLICGFIAAFSYVGKSQAIWVELTIGKPVSVKITELPDIATLYRGQVLGAEVKGAVAVNGRTVIEDDTWAEVTVVDFKCTKKKKKTCKSFQVVVEVTAVKSIDGQPISLYSQQYKINMSEDVQAIGQILTGYTKNNYRIRT
jgi:hypothetical protein